MVTFLDGDAAGVTLALRRAPAFLRVVRSPRGNWDALDQLDDEPKPNETIIVYRRRDDLPINRFHLLCRPRSASGYYMRASYSVLAKQPTDSDVRATDAWRAWASSRIASPHAAEMRAALGK